MQDYIDQSNETEMYKMFPLKAKNEHGKHKTLKKLKVLCNNKPCPLAKVMVITDIFIAFFSPQATEKTGNAY